MNGPGSPSSALFAIGQPVDGLVVSQFLTLYITPVIYLYLERVQEWLRGEQSSQRAESEVAVG